MKIKPKHVLSLWACFNPFWCELSACDTGSFQQTAGEREGTGGHHNWGALDFWRANF